MGFTHNPERYPHCAIDMARLQAGLSSNRPARLSHAFSLRTNDCQALSLARQGRGVHRTRRRHLGRGRHALGRYARARHECDGRLSRRDARQVCRPERPRSHSGLWWQTRQLGEHARTGAIDRRRDFGFASHRATIANEFQRPDRGDLRSREHSGRHRGFERQSANGRHQFHSARSRKSRDRFASRDEYRRPSG